MNATTNISQHCDVNKKMAIVVHGFNESNMIVKTEGKINFKRLHPKVTKQLLGLNR